MTEKKNLVLYFPVGAKYRYVVSSDLNFKGCFRQMAELACPVPEKKLILQPTQNAVN